MPGPQGTRTPRPNERKLRSVSAFLAKLSLAVSYFERSEGHTLDRREAQRSVSPQHPEKHPERYRWIVDGHNVIFAAPQWAGLQLSGDRTGARRALEDRLESFGRAIGSQVWVVFDGNTDPRNPEAWDRLHLRAFYSGVEEEADDRIFLLAHQSIQKGELVAVVTSDRRTLGARLPRAARVVTAARFLRLAGAKTSTPEKWMGGSLADVERHFLSGSPFAEDRAMAEGEEETGDDSDAAPK